MSYPSDLTDTEWAVLEPEARAVMTELVRVSGRPMVHDLRATLDAIGYLARYGIEWRALPVDFPPFLWNLTCPICCCLPWSNGCDREERCCGWDADLARRLPGWCGDVGQSLEELVESGLPVVDRGAFVVGEWDG
jgi:hypothetical protein